jgi:hypothetical protein
MELPYYIYFPFFYFLSDIRDSAHLNLSDAGTFQGAKFVSILLNIMFQSAGDNDSSMAIYLRNAKITVTGSILTGQISIHALQVVHAKISSLEI